MSEKKKVTPVTQNEKIMTKYDLKMQRRKEEAAKAKKEELKGTIIGIVLVVALAAFVASFPIRSWYAVNGKYIKVGGEKVTQVEFAFQYNQVKQNYIQQMGSFLSMLGITDVSTMENQMYSDTLTYGDYFASMAAENIKTNRGVMAKAKAEGFTYDAAPELQTLKTQLTTIAKEAGVTLDAYLASIYGSLATWNRLEPYFAENITLAGFYTWFTENNIPSEDDLNAEYEANKDDYDCVDYHLSFVKAELPTTAPDGKVEKDADGKEIPYEPTEEEIAKAMAAAKKEAEKLEKTVAKDGDEYIGKRKTAVGTWYQEFLFDASRKPGDTAVIEDANNDRYLIVSFDKRYKDEAPTHDVRMIYSTATTAQTILNEWKAGKATEESFISLVQAYDENGSASVGGLYSGITASYFGEEVGKWLAEERKAGDTTAITTEDGSNFVVYYVAEGDSSWKVDAESLLVENRLTAFMEEAVKGVEIEDPRGKLAYLTVESTVSEESSEAAE